jgi:putative aldouronate transport system substrate-binding protein
MYMTSSFSYGSSSSNSLFTGGYNTATGAQVGGELDWVVNEDGEAVACCISDELKDYLQLINQWWDEGLISEDSLSITNVGDIKTYTAQGKVGFWVAQTSTFTLEVDDTYNPVAIKNITKEKGGTVRVGNYSNTRGSSGWAISTDCEYPEIAAGVINWFWTEEGYIATNYGEEGVTFNYDENGDVVFTDLILNNDNGYNSLYNSCSEIIYFDFPIFYSLTRKAATFSTQEQYDSQTIWGSNETNELRYFGDLNVEESATYSSLVGDISTYVAENLTKFATGEKSFDEWDAYVEQVESMGIQQLIDVKTAAYQRYLQR